MPNRRYAKFHRKKRQKNVCKWFANFSSTKRLLNLLDVIKRFRGNAIDGISRKITKTKRIANEPNGAESVSLWLISSCVQCDVDRSKHSSQQKQLVQSTRFRFLLLIWIPSKLSPADWSRNGWSVTIWSPLFYVICHKAINIFFSWDFFFFRFIFVFVGWE